MFQNTQIVLFLCNREHGGISSQGLPSLDCSFYHKTDSNIKITIEGSQEILILTRQVSSLLTTSFNIVSNFIRRHQTWILLPFCPESNTDINPLKPKKFSSYRKENGASVPKIIWLILFKKILTVYSENRMKKNHA